MIHTIYIPQQGPEQWDIINVALSKLNLRPQLAGITIAQIIQNQDGMSIDSQLICQSDSQKASATGYQKAHTVSLVGHQQESPD
jgi:hypothetical protein